MNTQSSLHALTGGAAIKGSLTQSLAASSQRVGSSPAVAVGGLAPHRAASRERQS